MTALTTAANAVAGIIMLMPLIIFSVLAFWKLNTVLFMISGAVALMTGCYAADIVTGGMTDELSITISLSLFTLWLICWSLSFWAMFRPVRVNNNG